MPFLFAKPAFAAEPANDQVTIDLSATVAERCGLASDGQLGSSGADLDAATSLKFDFRIDCNTRFRIGVSSANGALRLVEAGAARTIAAPPADDGFARDKAYEVALRIETDGSPLTPAPCSSRQLTSGDACAFYGATASEGLSSGDETAIDRTGSLTVSWPASGGSGEPRRIAGTYSDTITIVVGASS